MLAFVFMSACFDDTCFNNTVRQSEQEACVGRNEGKKVQIGNAAPLPSASTCFWIQKLQENLMSALCGENGQNSLRVKSNSKEPRDPSNLRELTHESLWLNTCSQQVCEIARLDWHWDLFHFFSSTFLAFSTPLFYMPTPLQQLFALIFLHLYFHINISRLAAGRLMRAGTFRISAPRLFLKAVGLHGFMFWVFICCVITTHTLHFNPLCSLKTDKYACKVLCWHT